MSLQLQIVQKKKTLIPGYNCQPSGGIQIPITQRVDQVAEQLRVTDEETNQRRKAKIQLVTQHRVLSNLTIIIQGTAANNADV